MNRINANWYDVGSVGEKFVSKFQELADTILSAEGLSGHIASTVVMEDIPGNWGQQLPEIMKCALDSIAGTLGPDDEELADAIRSTNDVRFLLGQVPDGGRCVAILILSPKPKSPWKFWS